METIPHFIAYKPIVRGNENLLLSAPLISRRVRSTFRPRWRIVLWWKACVEIHHFLSFLDMLTSSV